MEIKPAIENAKDCSFKILAILADILSVSSVSSSSGVRVVFDW